VNIGSLPLRVRLPNLSLSKPNAITVEVRTISNDEMAAIVGSKLSRSALNMRRGSVALSPEEIKNAIEISSKEARKAKSAAIVIDVRRAGNVTVIRTRNGGAPRLWAAISND
jgi:hypothetical protein